MFETIWFIIWGVAWAVYFMLDGFDLGLGTLFPFLTRSEADKRVVINAMGPFWDGNEVWLITAGGVTFAAFPRAYAVMFSSLYTPLRPGPATWPGGSGWPRRPWRWCSWS